MRNSIFFFRAKFSDHFIELWKIYDGVIAKTATASLFADISNEFSFQGFLDRKITVFSVIIHEGANIKAVSIYGICFSFSQSIQFVDKIFIFFSLRFTPISSRMYSRAIIQIAQANT